MKKKSIFYILGPMLLAFFSYMQARNQLILFHQNTGTTLLKSYLINKILIFPNYTVFDYMEGRNIFDLIPVYGFFLLCILLNSLSFLECGKSYFQFVLPRFKTLNLFIKNWLIRGDMKVCLFVLLYHSLLTIFIFTDNSFLLNESYWQLFQPILFLTLSRSILLMSLFNIFFFIFLSHGEITFLMTIMFTIAILLMININFPSLSIMLLWKNTFWVKSILFSSTLLSLTIIFGKRSRFFLS